MPRVSREVSVTEPLMSNGVWQLAAWRWRMTQTWTHTEIEDQYSSLAGLGLRADTEARVAFDSWIELMPAIHKYNQRLGLGMKRDVLHDLVMFTADASGWFELSDDEAATERMLALVNVEKIDGVRTMVWVGGAPGLRLGRCIEDNTESFADILRAQSVLRPGTADNDINPLVSFVPPPLDINDTDFTTDNLRIRATERHVVHRSFDPRAIYGTFMPNCNERLDPTPEVEAAQRERVAREADESMNRRMRLAQTTLDRLYDRALERSTEVVGEPRLEPLYGSPARIMMPPPYRNDGGVPHVDDRRDEPRADGEPVVGPDGPADPAAT